MRKHIGTIFEDRWKVVERQTIYKTHSRYILENIFNGNKISVRDNVLTKLVKGETSVSQVLHYRIKRGFPKKLLKGKEDD